MSMIPYAVLNIQQGLSAYYDTGRIEVSPGRVDGAWGPATQSSYLAFLALGGSTQAALAAERTRVSAFPLNSRMITLPSAAAAELGAAAVAYAQRRPSGELPIPGTQPQPSHEGWTVMPPLPPSAPRSQSNILPIVLGLGAAVIVAGGVYYFWAR